MEARHPLDVGCSCTLQVGVTGIKTMTENTFTSNAGSTLLPSIMAIHPVFQYLPLDASTYVENICSVQDLSARPYRPWIQCCNNQNSTSDSLVPFLPMSIGPITQQPFFYYRIGRQCITVSAEGYGRPYVTILNYTELV